MLPDPLAKVLDASVETRLPQGLEQAQGEVCVTLEDLLDVVLNARFVDLLRLALRSSIIVHITYELGVS